MAIAWTESSPSALYDTTTDIAFGPVFEDSGEAQNFLEWTDAVSLPDPRLWNSSDWATHYSRYTDLDKCFFCLNRKQELRADNQDKPICEDCALDDEWDSFGAFTPEIVIE